MASLKQLGKDTHTINRGKICVVCLGKAKRTLTPNLIDGLNRFTSLFNDISPDDEKVPTGICENCRKLLKQKECGKAPDKDFRIPTDFTFNSVVNVNSDHPCNCTLCKIALSVGGLFTKSNQPKKVTKTEKPSEEKRLCGKCLSVMGKGLSHACNDHTALENLKLVWNK